MTSEMEECAERVIALETTLIEHYSNCYNCIKRDRNFLKICTSVSKRNELTLKNNLKFKLMDLQGNLQGWEHSG